MKIAFRRMEPGDADRVHELEEQIFKDAWSRESFIKDINNRDISYPFVVLDESKIAGYAVIWYFADELHIGNIAIAPEYRRKGLASRLLEYVLDNFDHYIAAYLEVRKSNIAAINLYRKFGFSEYYTRPSYYRDGEDALVMVKQNIAQKVKE